MLYLFFLITFFYWHSKRDKACTSYRSVGLDDMQNGVSNDITEAMTPENSANVFVLDIQARTSYVSKNRKKKSSHATQTKFKLYFKNLEYFEKHLLMQKFRANFISRSFFTSKSADELKQDLPWSEWFNRYNYFHIGVF